jgi:low temperature requirement protein LtrA
MSEAPQEPRRADWFELFFDLVFVVMVAVLAQGLHGDPDWRSFATFLVLFFPAWWAWVNLMVSVNLFGANDRWNRILLVGAMPGLGLMAAAAPFGLDGRSWAYAIGAGWVRLVIFALWWRHVGAEWELPAWRPIAYALVSGVLFVASAFVPAPARYVLWFLAIAWEVVLLTLESGQSRQTYGRLAVDHLVERIGLFVVIVFGESVFAVVIGLSQHFTQLSGVAALGSFVTVAALAIIFFQYSTASAERAIARAQASDARSRLRWGVMYLPYALISGITMLAAALGTAVAEPSHHLPRGSIAGLIGGLLIYYASSGVFERRLGMRWGEMTQWLVPGLLAPLIVLLPLAFLLPAWGTAVATGVIGLGLLVNDALLVKHPSAG